MPVLGNIARSRAVRAAIAGLAVSLGSLTALPQPAAAATETIIHAFTGPTADGLNPTTGLVKGPDGYFYGTTNHGGAGGYGIKSGTIFQLKPPTVGHPSWTYSVIWSFKGAANGSWPNGPLVFDANGTGYGVALQGGDTTDCNQGCGVAYSIVPPAPGKKLGVYRVIHKFHSAAGSSPIGALTFDGAGNLYGSTMYGGGDNYCTGDKGGCGVIFRLNKPAMGKLAWPQTTLYRFQHAFGAVPNGGLVFDAGETALFGTAQGGGTSPLDGVVFRLSKPAPGHFAWTYSVLHDFTGKDHSDGSEPVSGLTFDSSGNLYGTTRYGGSTNCNNGCGIVFKLDSGTLTYSTVRAFQGGADGRDGTSGLIYDGTALYGTTEYGGSSTCGIGCGTIYKIALSPSTSYSQLFKFVNNGDSIDPQFGPLAMLNANTLLGTAQAGGGPFMGTVYSLTLP